MADMVEAELASGSAAGIIAAPSDTTTPPQHQHQHQHQNQTSPSEPSDTPEPIFPPLHNTAAADSDSLASGPSAPSRTGLGGPPRDNDEDEPAIAQPFHRSSSPNPPSRPGLSKVVDHDDDESHVGGSAGDGQGPRPRLKQQMHRYSLYETASRFYIVGGDATEKRYRILKIDRTNDDASELSITDDKTVYTQKDMNQLLDTIDDGNKGTGGLRLRCTTWGLLGFIKFTGPYYMMLITKKSTVAMIGGHYVYQIDGTELVPLTSPNFKADQRNTEESRFLGILNQLDLNRSFYYSYSYDLTRTLQHNITRERTALLAGRPCSMDDDFNSMFVWNNHLLQPAAKVLNAPFDWCRPIIHGYIDQAAVSVYGRTAHITIIARRSRYFAGARFLKRGANDLGYVANDVETEQIVSEAMTTSFHAPGPKFFANPTYTSYVQHRGSIPLYWTQDNTGVTPKPPIELNLVDPFYTAAALHFDNLFERYGAPIYALNLIKARERTPRESKLLEEYTRAIAYLNQFLPDDKKIIHRAWDMSRAAKSRDQDVIGTLESIAEEVVRTTGFFQNGDGHISPIRTQNGVARTNCIDCLDRTNAAQFVIGKRALGHQLHALGILGDTSIEYDTDAVNLFTHMYHDHGDTIAVQYGGSQLVNTMETYRKINQWTSHSRDMIESFKRYYNNSFLDGQRQEAYNLFLGNYIFAQGQPMLWDLATDYYLHHEDPRTWLEKRKRDYIHWYTPEFLKERVLPPYPAIPPALNGKPISAYDDYWLEYYRPSTLSSFPKMFPYRMNSTIKYIPFKSTQDGRYDLSPFRVRNDTDGSAHEKRKAKKEVTIVAPQDLARLADDTETSSINEKPSSPAPSGRISLHRWLHEKHPANGAYLHPNSNPNHHHHHRHPSIGSQTHSRNNSADETATPFSTHHQHPQQHHHHHHHRHNSHSEPLPHQQQGKQNNHHHHQSLVSISSSIGIGIGGADAPPDKPHQTALEKSRAATQTFTQVVHDSLNPSVSAAEADDYARYVSHPHNLPLVISASDDAADVSLLLPPGEEVESEYLEFVNGGWREEGLGRVGDLVATADGDGSFGGAWGGWEGRWRWGQEEEDRVLYAETVRGVENPLTVTEEDAQKKRYKAYRKWLRGKSLFKQQPVD
ncbi:hypothetical protein NEMBOFW57_007308 [Staphylotrichum longicolle]|uniref:SAC domain-containing protein n=1 Tax=Staphylotrichum longicolle TaxID=669026 RepID=A0AAD4I0C2_9PEZI|nr:hypothetical protein NEMBOFW57_007308 [Staphylotrichum longicolle]